MREKEIIEVDLKDVESYQDFHERFIEPFGLEDPEQCGMFEGYKYAKNMDALWDLLDMRFLEVDGGDVKITFHYFSKVPKYLDEKKKILQGIFDDLKVQAKEDYNKTIEVIYE